MNAVISQIKKEDENPSSFCIINYTKINKKHILFIESEVITNVL